MNPSGLGNPKSIYQRDYAPKPELSDNFHIETFQFPIPNPQSPGRLPNHVTALASCGTADQTNKDASTRRLHTPCHFWQKQVRWKSDNWLACFVFCTRFTIYNIRKHTEALNLDLTDLRFSESSSTHRLSGSSRLGVRNIVNLLW